MKTLMSERDPVEQLAEEFVERYRRGEHPEVSDYTKAHPEHAERIRELFPAVLFVEQLGGEGTAISGSTTKVDAPKLPPTLGEFRIVREIGRGGMGVVYEAVQEPLGRHVALKVLPQSLIPNPQYRERFQREAKAAARLHHTNIVPVFGVGEHEGHQYYAMQFIHGQTLDAVCRQLVRLRGETSVASDSEPSVPLVANLATSLHTGRFTPTPATEATPLDGQPQSTGQLRKPSAATEHTVNTENEYYRNIARVGADVARALAHAHQQGVLHRDIKPSNLLLDKQGTVWVTDFGLAKMEGADELTGTGDIVGTLRYMAPERFEGKSDPRSDVYGLGVTLYELLCLRPAFGETDRPKLLQQLLHAEPAPLRQLDPRVPRDLETIVGKAMSKEPGERYQSAELLADDLESFLSDRPIRARRTSLVERTWRWCRRNPRLARLSTAVAGLLAIILIGLPIMLVVLWEQRQQAREELWQSQLARAESQRLTNQAGRRFQGLAILGDARRLMPRLASDPDREMSIRNQVLACLSLADLGVAHQWDGYPQGTTGVAIDPTLERYARSDSLGNISIRRIADDREIAGLPGVGQAAWSLRFSPDGRYLAAGYQCALQSPAIQVQIWDIDLGRAVLQVQSKLACGEAGFSADGRFVAIGRDERMLSLYDLTTGDKLIKDLKLGSRPEYVAFHPDGKKLAVSQPKGVEIREVESGKVLEFWEHDREPRALAWRHDGKQLAVASGWGIYIWVENSTRPQLVFRAHEGTATELAYSHAGDLLASKAGDGTVRLWDIPGQRQLVRTSCVYTGCSALHFSPDDRQLGYGSDGARLWLWDVASGRECRTLWTPRTGNWQTLMGSFSSDSRYLTAAGNTGFYVWDLDTDAKPAFAPLTETHSVHFHPSERVLYSTSKSGLHRWALRHDEKSGSLQIADKKALWEKCPLSFSALSPDGRTLTTRREPDAAMVFDLTKTPPTNCVINHPQLQYIAYSPDSRVVATGTWYGNGVKLWHAADGGLEREISMPGSADVSFSPDGASLVIGTDRNYQFFGTDNWQRRQLVAKQPEIGTGSIAFANDGSLAVIRHSPTQLRLIDPASGRLLAELQPPEQRTFVWHCLSPDGRRLAASGPGGPIYAWDLPLPRRQLAERGLDW